MDNVPGALGRLATAIGDAGGNISQLAGFEVRGDHLVEDVTVNCLSEAHITEVVDAVRGVDGMEVLEVVDRTFEIHQGGKIEVLAHLPIADRDDLSMAYTPGVARVCMNDPRRAGQRPRPHDQGQHRRHRHRRHRRARPRRHRPRGGAAGDGGQGAAVQGVRRRRRLPDLPRRRTRRRRDRRDGAAHRPGLRRHQPRGHRRPGVLRGRGAAARPPRHPRVPRRPARHRRRRCWPRSRTRSGRRQADARPARRHLRRRRRRRRHRQDPHGRRRPGRSSACDRKGAVHTGRDDLNASKQWFAENTNPDGFSGTVGEALAGADVFVGVSAPDVITADDVRDHGEGPDRVRHGQPQPRDPARADPGPRRRHRHRPQRLPQPDQQRARLPRHLPGRARRPGHGDHRER